MPMPVNSPQFGPALLVTLVAVVTFFHVAKLGAQAQSPPNQSALDSITVEAQRQHAELEKEVHHFLSTALVRHNDWSEIRWNTATAGLSRDQGEFVLTRISEVARNAGAKLAAEKCRPNFFVIVTGDPEALLKKWRQRSPGKLDSTFGVTQINRFIDTPRPVRAWYNAEISAAAGNPLPTTLMDGIVVQVNPHVRDTRLEFSSIRAISSAILVIDSNKVLGLNFGQLADYVALLGMAGNRSGSGFRHCPYHPESLR